MNNLAYKINPDVESFRSELDEMITAAKSPEERVALKAFARAMSPYFDQPEKLRSSVGKIQAAIFTDDVQKNIEAREFASIDDIKELLPPDVSVRLEDD